MKAFSRAFGDHAVALGVLPTGLRMLREAGSIYYAAVPARHVLPALRA